eukprot:14853094-Heterocapsa_arctica.AAC.1
MSRAHPVQQELRRSLHGTVHHAATLGDLSRALTEDAGVLMRLDGWKPQDLRVYRIAAIRDGPSAFPPILLTRNR